MKYNLNKAIDLILGVEGGFVDNPHDNGGATNMGITIGTLSSYRGYDVSVGEIKNLTREEATNIYKSRYWDVVKADDLPPGVDIVVFDMAVNAGPHRAAVLLQKAVGSVADGKVGPNTLAAVRATERLSNLIEHYTQLRLSFYKRLDDWKHFGNGWTNRAKKVEAIALEAATGKKPSLGTPNVEPVETQSKPNILSEIFGFLKAIVWMFKNRKR